MASILSPAQKAKMIKDSIDHIKDALLKAYTAHHPVPDKGYDGSNIDYVFNKIIKAEYEFIAAIMKEIAKPAISVLQKEGITITKDDYFPVLDYAIMIGIEQLKKSGIYLTAESSENTPKIRKLYIPDGHNFFREILSIPNKDIDRVLLLKKEETKKAAAAAAAAANLMAEEAEEVVKQKSAKAKKGTKKLAPTSELEKLAREAAAEYNAKKVANAGAGSPDKLPNAGPDKLPNAGPVKPPNAPPRAGAGSAASASTSNSFMAAAQAHMRKLQENPVMAAAAREKSQRSMTEALQARGQAATRAAAITSDPKVQNFMHWMMNLIHKIVYSDITVQELHKIMPATPITLDKLTDIVRLYFHGGNSVSFYTKARNALDNIPYESDFDMICLVNPHIPDFARVRRLIFGAIITRVTAILNTDEKTEYGKWKLNIIDYYGSPNFTQTTRYNVLSYMGPVSEDDRVLFDSTLMARLTEKSFIPTPLDVTIVPNVSYSSEGSPKQLGIASIKMATSNHAYSRQIELFEITCPSRQYEHLETLWEVVDLTLVTVTGYSFYVPTPVSLYLEQRIAYEGTPPSLSEKKSKRLTRSNNMKRYVREKYNAGNAKIRFNLNAVVGDYEEPIHSYINNIKA